MCFLSLNLPVSLFYKPTITDKERQIKALSKGVTPRVTISRMSDYCSHTAPSILSPQL